MGKITAYKCDVCGKVSEDEPKYTFKSAWYGGGVTNEFRLNVGSGSDSMACGDNCLAIAMNNWRDARIAQQQKEDDEIEKVRADIESPVAIEATRVTGQCITQKIDRLINFVTPVEPA